jgi:hypothetical protein
LLKADIKVVGEKIYIFGEDMDTVRQRFYQYYEDALGADKGNTILATSRKLVSGSKFMKDDTKFYKAGSKKTERLYLYWKVE